MILHNFISLQAFTVYTEKSLWFEISLCSIWPKWNLHQSKLHYARSHVNADNEVTSHRSEILSQSEISLRCEVTLLSVFTWLWAEWNSLRWKFHFGQIDSLRFACPLLLLFRKQTIVQHLFCINSVWINYTKSFAHVQ